MTLIKPRFVIFDSMRTGSNFLVSRLNQIEEIICHGELFNPAFVGLREDLMDHFEIRRDDAARRDADVEHFINSTLGKFPDKITGFRVSPHHSSHAVDWILGSSDYKRVLLRRDILTSYISLCQARESGIWSIDSADKAGREKQKRYGRKIQFDPSCYEKYRDEVQSFHRKVQEDAEKKGLNLFEIWYKNLQKPDKLNELLDFLGIEERGHQFDATSIQLSNADLEGRVENFGDVLDYLYRAHKNHPLVASNEAGRKFLALGKFVEAEGAYRSTIEGYPTRAEGYVGLAQIEAKNKNWEEALASWRACIERFPKQVDPRWHVEIGRILLALERPDEAEAVYQEMIERYPERAEGYVALARFEDRTNNLEEALEGWRLCLDRFSDQANPLWYAETARILVSMGRLGEAELVYQSMVERYPEGKEGYIGLAEVAAKKMDWRCSLERWELVCKKFKDEISDADRLSRARAYTMMGHFDSAEQIITEITNELPNWPAGWIQRASNAVSRRDEEQARQLWLDARVRFCKAVDSNLSYRRFLNSLSDELPHIVVDYRDVGESPRKAFRHINDLKVLEGDSSPLVAARHYARVFPDSAPIHELLAWHMRKNIRASDDLSELLETTEGLCKRFPDSRKIWIERARALICANQLERTAEAVRRIETKFGRCADTDELIAWVAGSEGDHDRAKAISEHLLEEQYSFAVHGELKRFERVDSNRKPHMQDKILLFCVVRDEIDFLPWFFDYYRSIGVNWFFCVDNGSIDGSMEFLRKQPDASVFWTDDNFHQADSGMLWINELISRYGDGNWCIFVDADEQLVVPGSKETGLRSVLDHMREQGDEVLFGFMLDMYPDTGDAFLSFKSGDDPQQFSPLFDSDYFVFGDWQSPYLSIEGGARERLFNTTHKLRKAPIVWGGAGIRYLTNHTTTSSRVSGVTGALLHYKIFRECRRVDRPRQIDVKERLADRSPHCKMSHDRYRQVLENLNLADFPKSPSTLTYKSPNQLVECGLISAVPDAPAENLSSGAHNRELFSQSNFAIDGLQLQCRRAQAENSVALSARARAFSMEENWERAIEQWEFCFSRFPAQAQPSWYGGLAQALMLTGQYKEAIQAYKDLVGVMGGVTSSVTKGLARAFLESKQSASLVKEYQCGSLMREEGIVEDFHVVASLFQCGLLSDARKVFDLVAWRSTDALAYNRCLSMIPILFDGDDREQRLLKCKDLVGGLLEKSQSDAESDLLLTIKLGALLALRDYQQFIDCSTRLTNSEGVTKILIPFAEVRRRLCNRGNIEDKQCKIFGIGLSKTGTSSLSAALEKLGFSVVHFVNPLTREIISDDDFQLFDAFSDTPVSYRFESIFEKFPDAKYIYTKRSIEDWEKSFTEHFKNNLDAPDWDELRKKINHPDGCRHGKIYQEIHNSLYCSHSDAVQAYQHYDERVNLFFQGARRNQLLEFDLFSGDGWTKLCDFVDRPVPNSPFPWKNKTADIDL